MMLTSDADYLVVLAPRQYLVIVGRGEGGLPQVDDFAAVTPDQRQTLTIDFGQFLPPNQWLAGEPVITLSTVSGPDAAPQTRILAPPAVGTAPLNQRGSGVPNAAILFQVGGCVAGTGYLVEASCPRSDGDVAAAFNHFSCVAPA